MKHILFLAVSILTLSSFSAFAAFSADSGKIIALYVSSGGNIAIRLDGGTPNANAANQCPNYNGWVGVATADATFKAALLAAKTTGAPVTIITEGCSPASPAWLGLKDVYVN